MPLRVVVCVLANIVEVIVLASSADALLRVDGPGETVEGGGRLNLSEKTLCQHCRRLSHPPLASLGLVL